MEECRLCRATKADKTGSHIVPHLLIKEFVNQDGFTSKNKEIAFTLSTKTPDVVKFFFGRGDLPDTIKEVLGNDLNETETELMSDPFVRDHVLCSSCESKLAVLESAFKTIVYSKKDRFIGEDTIRGLPILKSKSRIWCARSSILLFGELCRTP